MAMVKNTMEVIKEATDNIDIFYDLRVGNVNDIYCNSSNPIDMIINAFRFGYMQCSKATKAYINKQKERK